MSGQWIKATAYTVGRVIAALIVGPMLMMIEFCIAFIAFLLGCKWILYVVIYPAQAIQGWLEQHGALTPQTGGHMPDFGFVFGFNSVVNVVVLLILLFRYPNLLSGFFTPRRVSA